MLIDFINQTLLLPIGMLIYLSVVLMHIAYKKSHVIYLYTLQSILTLCIVSFLLLDKISFLMVIMIILTFLVKIIFAPIFFFKIVKKYKLVFSVANYLNTPSTLFVITLITVVSKSDMLKSIFSFLNPVRTGFLLPLFIASFFISLFLIINRKGALSQIIGVLALENSLVAFSAITGLEQSPGIEIAIIFNLLIWTAIASIFITIIFKHFGAVNIDKLTYLKE